MTKNKRKVTTLILALLMILSFTAGAQPVTQETPGTGNLKPGTYTGKVERAYGGPLTVEVTVNEDSIESIEVTEHSETVGIGSNAIEKMPGRIIEAQSINLDTMTGCTISSASVLAAVKNALSQASDNIDAFNIKPEVIPQDSQKEVDVVVVGAGMAGLAAAIGAADEGASVILLEKAAQTGGASATSGGEIIAAGTSVQKEAGIEDSAEALAEYFLEMGEGKVDEALVRYVAESTPELVDWLKGMGINLRLKPAHGMPWMDPLREHQTDEGAASLTGMGGGVGFTLPMTKEAQDKGVEILLETPAVSLIMEDKAVVGVIAETKQGEKVTIKAKNVILATGGFDGNDEMMKQHMPYALGRAAVGRLHNGDGHRMAQEAGAKMYYPETAAIALASNQTALRGFELEAYGPYLFVLPNGQRFVDESKYWFVRSGELTRSKASLYWTVFTEEVGVPNLEKSLENGWAMKADSIAELAQQMEIDPQALEATIARYNEMCEAGVDSDFGKTNENMIKMGFEGTNLIALDKAPYYAVKVPFSTVVGTAGGPVINIDGQVLNDMSEEIKGLYAVGELATATFYNLFYPASGTSLSYCAIIGRRAGAHAANAE